MDHLTFSSPVHSQSKHIATLTLDRSYTSRMIAHIDFLFELSQSVWIMFFLIVEQARMICPVAFECEVYRAELRY